MQVLQRLQRVLICVRGAQGFGQIILSLKGVELLDRFGFNKNLICLLAYFYFLVENHIIEL